jgi:hypothetical protein
MAVKPDSGWYLGAHPDPRSLHSSQISLRDSIRKYFSVAWELGG